MAAIFTAHSTASLSGTDPCPWCGGDHVRLEPELRDGCHDGEVDAWACAASCVCCGAEGPWRKGTTQAESATRALDAWERRVRPTADLLAAALAVADGYRIERDQLYAAIQHFRDEDASQCATNRLLSMVED